MTGEERVTFYGTPAIARRAARAQLRAPWLRTRDTLDEVPWQREWRHYSSVITGLLLEGNLPAVADLYAAALVMRLARWEYSTQHGLAARRRRAAAVSR
jgi:hypothetical protein